MNNLTSFMSTPRKRKHKHFSDDLRDEIIQNESQSDKLDSEPLRIKNISDPHAKFDKPLIEEPQEENIQIPLIDEESLKQLRLRIQELERKNHNSKLIIIELNDKIREYSITLAQAQNEINTLQSVINTNKLETPISNELINNYETTIRDLEDRLNQSNQTNKELENRLKQIYQANNELESRTNGDLENRLKQLSQINKDLENRLKQLNQTNKDLTYRLNQSYQTNKELEYRLNHSSHSNNDTEYKLKQYIAELEKQRAAIEDRLKLTESKLNQSYQTNNELEKQRDAIEDRLYLVESKLNQSYQTNNESIKNEIIRREREIFNKTMEIEHKQEQLLISQRKIKQKEEDYKKEVKDKENQLAIAREKFYAYKEQEIEALKRMKQEQLNELERYKQEQLNELQIKRMEQEQLIQEQLSELQSKKDNAIYQHKLMTNKIQAYNLRPELQFREEYPEYFQAKVMDMKQTERHDREIKHAQHLGEIERVKIEEKQKTQKLIDAPRLEFEANRNYQIKKSREQLYGIARINHQKYPDAPALDVDILNSHSYYLYDKIDPGKDFDNDSYGENDKFYLKIKRILNNYYLYICPKY